MAFRKQRMGRKSMLFYKNNITYIDYKDVELLKDSFQQMVKLFQDV